MKVLCVDDDSISLRIYKNVLLENGYESSDVCVSRSAAEALEQIEKDSFDIVLTDLVMPQMSGLDLLKRIKQIRPQIEVIVVTAFASLDTAITAMKLGARDYLTKPLDTSLILEKLKNIRDYIEQKREAEDYRFAKEYVELSIHQSVSALEQKLASYIGLITDLKGVLHSASPDADKLSRMEEMLRSFSGDGR